MFYECNGCGEEICTENEDEVVASTCDMCAEFGVDFAEERGEGATHEYCSCEDYPCCGH